MQWGRGQGLLVSKEGFSSGAGMADREGLLMLTRGSGLCVIGLGSILSLLYTFVIHIVAITVCFLYNFFSSKLFLSQPLMFAFCVPSNPIQPPAREEKQVSSMWFWSLGAVGTKLQSMIPKPHHVVMLPVEAFQTSATGNSNYRPFLCRCSWWILVIKWSLALEHPVAYSEFWNLRFSHSATAFCVVFSV